MKVGIAFSLAPSDSLDSGPDDRFEEFDRPETVQAVASVIRGRGHEVVLLGDGPALVRTVLDTRLDLVFNMAEGEGIGRSREARVPAILELLGIPFTGSDPLTMAATLDKDVAKRLVASHGLVEVPRGVSLEPSTDRFAFESSVAPLLESGGATILLKPSFEGSSKGIRGRCLAESLGEAWQTFQDLARNYCQTILVEEFVRGEEVTVGVVGNGVKSLVIGSMSIRPRLLERDFVYSLEVKRDWRRRVAYEAPPSLTPELTSRIETSAIQAYLSLGCRDVARIDFRVRDGIPVFLEANPLPGLAPETSDLVILADGYGMTHADLIHRIFDAALDRLGLVG